MDNIIKEFGRKSADDLITITHKENSLWYAKAKENNLLKRFEDGLQTVSDVRIRFQDLIKDDPYKLVRYESYKEFTEFAQKHC